MMSLVTGMNTSSVKARNLSAVLLALLNHEGISRSHIARLIGVSSTTITNIINELLDQGIVIEEGSFSNGHNRAGRPHTALTLVPDARFAVGIQFGVGQIYIALTDLMAQIRAFRHFEFKVGTPVDNVLAEITARTEDLIAEQNIAAEKLLGVGVAASGLVDVANGINIIAPSLGWQNMPLREYFSYQLKLPVFVDNNVRAMALGEALFGIARQNRAVAFVYARTGVGAGLVVGGRLYRGAAAGAGEIGHMTIIPDGGDICHCGNVGCLETLISQSVILRLAEEIAAQNPESILAGMLSQDNSPSIDRVFAAARAGDADTLAMLQERARFMGIALANLVNVFNPELILLGGIFAEGADLLLPVVKETVQRRSFADLGRQVRVEPTSFGDQAGMVGAAALALDNFFYHEPLLNEGEEIVS